MGCRHLLQGIFPTQDLNLCVLLYCPLYRQVGALVLVPLIIQPYLIRGFPCFLKIEPYGMAQSEEVVIIETILLTGAQNNLR